MNNGFQITQDDIETVLQSYGVTYSQESLEKISELIEDSEVSSAAMSVDYSEGESDDDILDKQTEAAYDEIAKQLFKLNIITKEQVLANGNTLILDSFFDFF